MANTLTMADVHSIETLLQRGWSYRRIARALGIHRETVARHASPLTGTDSKPAISTPGVAGRPSECRGFQDAILAKVEKGLSALRIHQDLVHEHGFSGSYQSVKRFVRRLRRSTPLPFRRMECDPGEEAQADFGKGALTDRPGKCVFR